MEEIDEEVLSLLTEEEAIETEIVTAGEFRDELLDVIYQIDEKMNLNAQPPNPADISSSSQRLGE